MNICIVILLHNNLKLIAVIKMGYRMAATLILEEKKSYMNQIVKGVFLMLLLSDFVSYKYKHFEDPHSW